VLRHRLSLRDELEFYRSSMSLMEERHLLYQESSTSFGELREQAGHFSEEALIFAVERR